MSDLADLEVTPGEDRTLIHVRGEVDLSNADDLGRRIEKLVPNSVRSVTIDLSATTYLDSSGIRVLFRLAERLHARRQELTLVVPEGSPVRATLDVVHLSAVIPVLGSGDAR